MPVWHYITGYVLMIAAMGIIVLMIYASCKTVIADAEKEAKEDAEHLAKVLAERKYQEMLRRTTFRVRTGMRIVDETRRGK